MLLFLIARILAVLTGFVSVLSDNVSGVLFGILIVLAADSMERMEREVQRRREEILGSRDR